MINEIVKDLIKESEPQPSPDNGRGGNLSTRRQSEAKAGLETFQCKQIQLCSDAIHLLMLQPWDFLSRLKIGRTFERQVASLGAESENLRKLPYANSAGDSLLTRIIRCSNVDYGPDLIAFVIYRPDEPVFPFSDPFRDCSCRLKPHQTCRMQIGYEKAKIKYEKRKKSYQVEKTRRVSVPCLNIHDQMPAYERARRPSIPINPVTEIGVRQTFSPKLHPLESKRLGSRFSGPRSDPNERDKNGVTPLMLLCYHRTLCAKIAEILLDAHADPNQVTKNGNTVLDALFRDRNYLPECWDGLATFKLLLQYGLNVDFLPSIKTKIESAIYIRHGQKAAFLDAIQAALTADKNES